MSRITSEDEAADQQPSPPKWRGAHSTRLAHQLNEKCIELFCDLALDGPSELLWPCVALNRDLWSRLNLAARTRLAVFPFVIVDMCFKDEAWWMAASNEQSEASSYSSIARTMPSSRCEYLALETLMFAWQVAREDRHVAWMVFAMAPRVADCIAELTMRQIRTIASESTRFLRVRWDEDPRLWRDLLISAREADEARLVALRRDAKLLFCGELLQVRGS